MKNLFEVLKQKEGELERLQAEVEALRTAARLLADDMETAVMEATRRPASPSRQTAPARPMPQQYARVEGKSPVVPANAGVSPGNGKVHLPGDGSAHASGDEMYSAAWGNMPRQFP